MEVPYRIRVALMMLWLNVKAGVGVVVALVGAAVAIIVGLIIFAQLQTTADAFNMGTTGNATRTTLFTNVWNAMNLLVVGIIILAAAAVIGYVSMLRGRAG